MEVVITGFGQNSNIDHQVDPTHNAQRTSFRPTEHNVGSVQGGIYTTGWSYSNTAAKPAAGSDICSLRWTDPNRLLLLWALNVTVSTTTTYTASLIQDLAFYIARNFTVSPSGGTQIIPLAGGQCLRKSNMRNSGLDGSSGALWVSSGDLLTTGTRSLETQFSDYMSWLNPITTVNAPTSKDLFLCPGRSPHPLCFAANEGFVIQTPIGNAQAAGVSKFAFTMIHSEVGGY